MKRLVVAAAVLLVGCASNDVYWETTRADYVNHPTMTGQQLVDRDVAYCQAVAKGAYPMPALAASVTTTHHTGTYDGKQFDATSTTAPGTGQVIENIYNSYQAGEAQRSIYGQCMERLGWYARPLN